MIDGMWVRVDGVDYPVEFDNSGELVMFKDGHFNPIPEDFNLIITPELWKTLITIWPVSLNAEMPRIGEK